MSDLGNFLFLVFCIALGFCLGWQCHKETIEAEQEDNKPQLKP